MEKRRGGKRKGRKGSPRLQLLDPAVDTPTVELPVVGCRGIYQTIPVYGAPENINRTFNEGTQLVEYKVVDEAGNFARCSFHVTVRGSYHHHHHHHHHLMNVIKMARRTKSLLGHRTSKCVKP